MVMFSCRKLGCLSHSQNHQRLVQPAARRGPGRGARGLATPRRPGPPRLDAGLTGLPAALARLSAWTGAVGAGTIGSEAVADEPVTARALAGHIQRALNAGLLDDADLPGHQQLERRRQQAGRRGLCPCRPG